MSLLCYPYAQSARAAAVVLIWTSLVLTEHVLVKRFLRSKCHMALENYEMVYVVTCLHIVLLKMLCGSRKTGTVSARFPLVYRHTSLKNTKSVRFQLNLLSLIDSDHVLQVCASISSTLSTKIKNYQKRAAGKLNGTFPPAHFHRCA